jgi:hypothetical protein
MTLTERGTSYSVEVALLGNSVTGGRIGDGGDAAVPHCRLLSTMKSPVQADASAPERPNGPLR